MMHMQPGTWFRGSTAAIEDRRLSAEAKLVFCVLASHVNSAGLCWPSQASIGRVIGIGERQVRRHLKQLEAFGYVKSHRPPRPRGGGYSVTHYYLFYPKSHRSSDDRCDDLSAQSGPIESSVSRGQDGDVPGDNASGDDCNGRDISGLPRQMVQQNAGKTENPDETVGLTPSKPFEASHTGHRMTVTPVTGRQSHRSSDDRLTRTRTITRTRSSRAQEAAAPDPYQTLIRRITSMIRIDETAAGAWVTEHTEFYEAHAAGTLTEAALYQALTDGGIA